jgi:glycosyltransferase involved in cell wall biosynthesis
MIANFVYLGVVDAPNGAAVFFKTLMDNVSSLKSDKILDAKFYYENRDCNYIQLNKEKRSNKRIRLFVQKYAHKNIIICFVALYIIALRHAKKVISSIPVENVNVNDVWVFNDVFSAYYFLKMYPGLKNCALILHNNGDPSKMILDEFSRFKNTRIERFIEEAILLVLNQLSNIVFLSEDSKQIFLKKYENKFSNSINFHVIQNGIELPNRVPLLRKKSSDRLIGVSVGSICYRKGYDLLLAALQKSEEFKNKLKIYCVGNIQDSDIISNNESLNFVGAKSRDEISEYLENADFFILCSRDEGMPISIIEAMQLGLPIFATNVGAVYQMINDCEEGVLMEPTVESIESVLNKAISGKYDLKAMGEKSRLRYLSDFSLDIMLEKYRNLLRL